MTLSCILAGRRTALSTLGGTTQDLAELDIDLAAITHAGAWQSTRMPLQYAGKIDAGDRGRRGLPLQAVATNRSRKRDRSAVAGLRANLPDRPSGLR